MFVWTMSSAQCSPVRMVVYFVQGCRPGAVPFALRAYGSATNNHGNFPVQRLNKFVSRYIGLCRAFIVFPLFSSRGGGGGGVGIYRHITYLI